MAIPFFFISRQIYVKKKPYKYPACPWKHKDAKHTKVRYECEVCNARFVSQEYLRQHENTHNDPCVSSGVKVRLLEATLKDVLPAFRTGVLKGFPSLLAG